jgi:hypothetical protein
MTVIKGPWSGAVDGEPGTRPERRTVSRLRVLMEGKVFWEEGQRTGCSVHDLSEAGARISLPAHAHLPTEFHLMAPKTASGHAAALVWRAGSAAGVAFSASYELDEAWPLELEVRQDWAERQRREMRAQSPAATAPTKA